MPTSQVTVNTNCILKEQVAKMSQELAVAKDTISVHRPKVRIATCHVSRQWLALARHWLSPSIGCVIGVVGVAGWWSYKGPSCIRL